MVARELVPCFALTALLLACSACGGGSSPSEPAETESVTGSWVGTISGVAWQGVPAREGQFFLEIVQQPGTDSVVGTGIIVLFPLEGLAGTITGRLGHEWYLTFGNAGCVAQLRPDRPAGDRLEGSWFGWTCAMGSGDFDLDRQETTQGAPALPPG